MTVPVITNIPYGYCHCGCGQKTKICQGTDSRLGWKKGEPFKYIVGHTIRENSRKSIAKRSKSLTRHGHAKNGVKSGVYVSWTAMIARCKNPQSDTFIDYGGRGITVCDRWLTFENFYADMGDRPKGLSIDRINNDGNYEHGNCKWANIFEQINNRRPSHMFKTRKNNTTGYKGLTAWPDDMWHAEIVYKGIRYRSKRMKGADAASVWYVTKSIELHNQAVHDINFLGKPIQSQL